MENYSVSDFAKKLGVSVKTLQRWDRDGILVANRTPTNRRYYTEEQYTSYRGEVSLSDRILNILDSDKKDREKLVEIRNLVK